MILTGWFQDKDLWCAFVSCSHEVSVVEVSMDEGGDLQLSPEHAKVWQIFMSCILERLGVSGVYVNMDTLYDHKDIKMLSIRDPINAL